MNLILVGGFLGSGKTTGIVAACHQLARNRKVAVITNDQGQQQVDHFYVESLGLSTEEVSDGCFCCQYGQLEARIHKMTASSAPEFIFAEAVGSCTDLLATVVRPLKKFNPGIKVLLCVFVDAGLLTAFIENRASFVSDSVRYIYKKQMEEATALIVSKSDTITSSQVQALRLFLSNEYPGKHLIFQNSLGRESIGPWLALMERAGESVGQESPTIDYAVYGKGEAELAWFDKTITLTTERNDAPRMIRLLIGNIFDQLQEQRLMIGHLKFFLESALGSQKISFTTTSTTASVDILLPDTNRVTVLINARVLTSPEELLAIIHTAIDGIRSRFPCKIEEGAEAAFSPGYPSPTYRMTEARAH